MIKLSKLTDYAIVLLAELSQAEVGLLSAAQLANLSKLPEPTVAKLLKTLAQAKLISSVRGVSGGYRLDRDLSDISVGEIIELIEGPIKLTSCANGAGHCDIELYCSLNGRWGALSQQVRNLFYQQKIADLAPLSAVSLVAMRG